MTDTTTTPRYQEKREAILCAAARLFNEQGVKGATLAGIAASVGLVTNSVTYYCRKKEDLATACFLRSIAAFDAVALAAAADHAPTDPTSEPGVPTRLRAFFRGHAQLLADIEEGRHAPIIVFNDIRALPEAQTAEVSDLIDNRRIIDMPLNGRMFTSLLQLTPGAHTGSNSNLGNNQTYSMRGSVKELMRFYGIASIEAQGR